MVTLAAQRITDEEIRELEECIRELQQNTETLDPWINADLKFHRLIAKSTKNGLMLHLIEALSALVRETIQTLHSQRELRDSQATLRRHVQIFDALKARDPQRATRAMKEHFDATETVVQAVVERQTPAV
jgi:GntR family transcriptional repressor for pyruvate dehydrogenase complex